MVKHNVIIIDCDMSDELQKITSAELVKLMSLDSSIDDVESELERYETSYISICPFNQEIYNERHLIVASSRERLAEDLNRAMADV